ncbi:unnamed protein product [Knipowitschia caucasica]
MAENNVDPESGWIERAFDSTEDTLVAMENLLATLRAFEDVLRQQDVSIASSAEYCDNFCQALMHYAGSRNSMDHGLPLLEVYCLSINCFASARSYLTAESEKVGLILKRLALSCFELFLSVPEHEIPYEAWLQFHQSVQLAHSMLLDYGSTDLLALVQLTGEGGAWSNPVLTSLLTGQPTSPDEVEAYICLEGEDFMEMRVKHLEKMGEVAKAVVLAKACAECNFISNKCTFRQTYVSLLCHLLPSEEALSEISRLDCKDVMEITCNMETDGDENTAFILCTTFLTQQLQQQSLYCSWELILMWSKLQRKLDPALLSFLERCLQLGAIAKTVHHLLYLVRVIQTEVEDLGVAPSVELCVKALQLPKQDDSDMQISVCKTVSCLLSEDLEVCRACQLTEFLISPSQEVFRCLEELHLRPDHKNEQENMVVPNSLRCELLLALKSFWPFDPEFWDWKTLKHHCISLLGLKPESEEEDAPESQEKCKLIKNENIPGDLESQNRLNGVPKSNDKKKINFDLSEKQPSSKSKRGKFRCQVCKRSITDAQLAHHSKRHSQEHLHPCPICLERFRSRTQLIPHLSDHVNAPMVSLNEPSLKAQKGDEEERQSEEEEETEPGEIPVDPSLMMYYKSTHDPDVLEHIVQQVNNPKKPADSDEHVTFDYIFRHYTLQNRDEYPCPGTKCPKVFKHAKYLNVHLKSEHRGDENVKYFQKMKDKREKCVFCRKHLMSSYYDRRHSKTHTGDFPYTCLVMGCGGQFATPGELLLHKQTHGYQLSYQCELKGCYVTFSDLGQLYHHEAQHFRDAAFTCTAPKCKKFYFSKAAFSQHLATHGIHFSERDFEEQRKAKRVRFKASTINVLDNHHIKSDCSPPQEGDLGTSGRTSPMEPTKKVEAKTTLVAVCFDGSKFTCGFEKCGMTFSRARDVQRHLKCAHPEHLKMENKEHKRSRDRDRGFSSKKVKDEKRDSGIKGQEEPKLLCLSSKIRKEKKTTDSSSALKEIINRLCKLDLNCASTLSEPPELTPETPIELKPVFEKKPDVDKERDAKRTQDKGKPRPFACNLCTYRATKKCNLDRHYDGQHQSDHVIDAVSIEEVEPPPAKATRSSQKSMEQNAEEKGDTGETQNGRAKRLLAKDNLCYILDKFSKPFHCVAKNCEAAFSAQGGLVRHLQMVHHYNKSQLILESECDEGSSEVKDKKRPAPNSDEPQPQYKCHFANCHMSYHLKSSLARHTRDCHSQPEVTPKNENSTATAPDEDVTEKPQRNDHCQYFKSMRRSSRCQRKPVANSSPQRQDPDPQNVQSAQASSNTEQTQKINQKEQNENTKQKGKVPFVLKSQEEALQMCQDFFHAEAFPCMIHACDRVVGYRSSLRRHYLLVHELCIDKYENAEKELLLNAEELEVAIQRKSVRPTRAPSPNAVRKMEYQTEPDHPGEQPAPVSLHCIRTGTPDETPPDSMGFPKVQEEQPSVERNSILVGADDVLYGEPSTDEHAKETASVSHNSQTQERLSLEKIKPFLRPVTVDLTPPSSLRIIIDKGFVDLSNHKAKEMIKEKLKNRTVLVSIPRIREPLKRKNDLSEQPSNVMEVPHNPPHRLYEKTTHKASDFQVSFLKFVQEAVCTEKLLTSNKRQSSFRRSCSVKENNRLGVVHTRRRTHCQLLKPHAFSVDKKLKTILDKALAGCGDLAIRQLQHLRPVVVLGRPVCPASR